MTILGIDPGTTRVGYGLIGVKRGDPVFIDCGCFELGDTEKENRPYAAYKQVLKKIKETEPDIVAIEKVFFSRNKKTAMDVSEARGAVTVAVREEKLPFVSYTPSEVKKAVSTHGQTDKKGVGKMVVMLLGLKEVPKPDDAADALAVALCCAYDSRLKKVIDPVVKFRQNSTFRERNKKNDQ